MITQNDDISMIGYFFFHLSKMEISDNKIRFGNEILDTETMTVRTTDEPTKELIPSITLQLVTDSKSNLYNKSIPDNLKITIKNNNDELQSSQYTKDGVYCKDKKITLDTVIQFGIDGETHGSQFRYILGRKEYCVFLRDTEGITKIFTFDAKHCFMPVVLQLYYSFLSYNVLYRENGILEAKIRTCLLEELKHFLSIPEPLVKESFRYTDIFFIVSSFRPDFQKVGTSLEKVYEVKSMEKNPCNFYHEFLEFANFCLSEKNKGQPTNDTLPALTNFYILFQEWYRIVL